MTLSMLALPATDRALFEPVRLPAELVGAGYIELHAGDHAAENRWRVNGALCVRDAAFDFVGGCFEVASAGFDLLSTSRLSIAETTSLTCELGMFEAELTDFAGRDVLFSRYASMMNPAVWSEVDSDCLLQDVRFLVRALQRFCWVTAATKRPLWVLGV